MKIKLLIVLLLMLAGETFSQTPCTKADAQQKAGSWGRQDVDDLAMADASFPNEQRKPVLAKAQKVVELLKQATPQPLGIHASAQRSIRGGSFTKNGALPFGVTARYYNFLCMLDTPGDPERGQIVPNGETETVVAVEFNGFSRMLNVERLSIGKSMTTVNGEIMFFFPKQTGELKGLNLLKPGLYNNQRDEAVIITAGNRSPLKPVTREQYLQAFVKLANGKIKKMLDTLQKAPAANEITFAKLDGNSLMSAQQKAEIKAGALKRTKELEESYLKQIKEIEDVEIAKLESAIAGMSATERQMQAVIGADWGSASFVSESEPDSVRLVTIDRSFFDPALPRQTIQLITVYWSWNEKNPSKAELIRQFKQNFDFEALKQMLGK